MANTQYNAVSVGTTATLIIAANSRRKGLLIDNVTVAPITIGPDINITPTNTVRLKASASFGNGIPDGYRGAIYGISFAGTNDVRYWEWGE